MPMSRSVMIRMDMSVEDWIILREGLKTERFGHWLLSELIDQAVKYYDNHGPEELIPEPITFEVEGEVEWPFTSEPVDSLDHVDPLNHKPRVN